MGVYGQTGASAPKAGVHGYNSSSGYGVYGASASGVGVYGKGSPGGRFEGNVEVTGNQGVIFTEGLDYPMITRGVNKFVNPINSKYTGLGRWGLFKEQDALVIGIPSINGKKFEIAKYFEDGQRWVMMNINDDGVVDIDNKLKVNQYGIYGKNIGGDGIEGESSYGSGVYGHSSSSTFGSAGVKGICNNGIAGVYGSSTNSFGVHGASTNSHGIVGYSGGFTPPYPPNSHYGGLFGSAGVGARGLGVFGSAYATIDFNGGAGLDIAEWIKVSDPSISAGDVVIIDKNNKKHVLKSSSSYNTLVAGIISTAPNYLAGNLVENNEILDREEIRKRGYRMLALTGQVPCNVSTENGPIEIGDLLTTSNTPGYAMKVTDKMAAMGAIVGKAMEPLATGRGKIIVLVTLQ
jgi:hypothetical protein